MLRVLAFAGGLARAYPRLTHVRFISQGSLHAPSFEKDACAVAVLAQINGVASHDIVRNATIALSRMEHRSGSGTLDANNSGDGAGILFGMPHAFMQQVAIKEAGIVAGLPEPGEYASGLLFLANEEHVRANQVSALERVAARLDLKVLGWRRPPLDNSGLGKAALASEPYILQCFIGKTDAFPRGLDMERHLFLLRKLAQAELVHETEGFYIASLSSRTITYKGLLSPGQLSRYFLDLSNALLHTHVAIAHARFSTNTFPSWNAAQPHRLLCHNGEINTLRGNKNAMASKLLNMDLPFLAKEPFASKQITTAQLLPVTSDDKTDSGNLDAALELLQRGRSEDRSLAESVLMMMPSSAPCDAAAAAEVDALREYQACLQEPWDGPGLVAFTDGKEMGAMLDQHGSRPARYFLTQDDCLVLSSESGVVPLDAPGANIVERGRLEPGKLLLVDFARGEFRRGGGEGDFELELARKRPYAAWLKQGLVRLDEDVPVVNEAGANLDQAKFGHHAKAVEDILLPMINNARERAGGDKRNAEMAVLSSLPQLPFAYMKQLVAQVIHPPLDSCAQRLAMRLECAMGAGGEAESLFTEPSAAHCKRLWLSRPVLTDESMRALVDPVTLPCFFSARAREAEMGVALEQAIARVCDLAEDHVRDGARVLILSQLGAAAAAWAEIPIPSLLITGAVHHRLLQQGTRNRVALLVQPVDALESHDVACLLGFGADGVHAFAANARVRALVAQGRTKLSVDQALNNYRAALHDGVCLAMSRMGISALQAYKGAQTFECLGLDEAVCDVCFPGTPSRIGGAGFHRLAQDAQRLYSGSSSSGAESARKRTISRELEFDFQAVKRAVDLNQVEPAREIARRLGALVSKPVAAATTAADENCFVCRDDTKPSSSGGIKPITPNRLGVTSHYLANADQLQIVLHDDGASPQPHHDVYSMEDLAQLVHDLKHANPLAEVSIKLVSQVGVGAVAAGCVKAKAEHITIHSNSNASEDVPWELGLAETQHTLVLNDLRSRVTLQADAQAETARDVVIAALLGAEEVTLRNEESALVLAEDVRELMASLGFKTWNEMVGRSDRLRNGNGSSSKLELDHLLFPSARLNETAIVYRNKRQDHGLHQALDKVLVEQCMDVLEGRRVLQQQRVVMEVSNANRSLGSMLSYQVSKRFGPAGLSQSDSIVIQLKGHHAAGQSLGFALAHGITLDLCGSANDFVGKSLSGGKIILRPTATGSTNVILGNAALYGAARGEAYFAGAAGERFCVWNHGATAVVEGCGDYGCQYMTGGRVVVLGKTGHYFGAGMQGGLAYVFVPPPSNREEFASKCDLHTVDVVQVLASTDEEELRALVEQHVQHTGSELARALLEDWPRNVASFVQVRPRGANDIKTL